jgi:hypothetical protein
MANVMAGSGSLTADTESARSYLLSVSPVSVSFSFATAPISPACNSVTGNVVFPCMMEICASFS